MCQFKLFLSSIRLFYVELFEYICHMEIKPKLYKLIKRFITQSTKGSDVFIHNGSKWIIFVEDKKWVIELTKEGTLWYNYYFFQNIFELVDLDVVENQHYITKWVEDTVINGVKSIKGEYYKEIQKVEYTIQNGVKKTRRNGDSMDTEAEDAIQNGVKYTSWDPTGKKSLVEDTIQNGVIHTIDTTHHKNKLVEDTIQNGVKETELHKGNRPLAINDTIQHGVKKTGRGRHQSTWTVEYTIQNGVKETHSGCNLLINDFIEDAIQNGVKYTGGIGNPMWMGGKVEDTIQNGVKETHRDAERHPKTVEDAIQNGVKKTYSDKIPHEYDWSNQFTEEIDDIIQNGVKHTEKSLQIDGSCVIEDVIREGVKHTEYGDWLDGDERLDDIIDNGIKETHNDAYHHTGRVGGVIKNGVKQCIPSHTPLYNPMDFSVQYRENHRLDDVASVLEKGIKKTKVMDEWVNTDRIVDGVISKGVKKSPI